MALLDFTGKGIYCSQADVHIDPWQPVSRALITHAHSDHARAGSKRYLCTHLTRPILLHRLGHENFVESVDYGEPVSINGVRFSFHPAGHVIGSAQIRVEYRGEVWVVSGDYKTEDDGISGTFELVKCHTFITESTFGLPVFRWRPQAEIIGEINNWWDANQAEGKTSILTSYALGKAQRVLSAIDSSIGPIYCHGAVYNMNTVIRAMGLDLPIAHKIDDNVEVKDLTGALVITPGAALGSGWMRRFKAYATGAASGWMALRGARRRRSVDRGFVLSDHVDWDALNSAIQATGCERVIVTHGYTEIFARWLREQGYDARTEQTLFEGEAMTEED